MAVQSSAATRRASAGGAWRATRKASASIYRRRPLTALCASPHHDRPPIPPASRNSMTKLNADEEAASLRTKANEPQFMNLHELVTKARQNLNQNDCVYIVGATETETTMKRNRQALDSVAFRPRVLRDV